MLINYFLPTYFRTISSVFWVAMSLLNTTPYAANTLSTLKIVTEISHEHEVPVDIIKMCPALHDMVEDLGGYEAHSHAAPIPLPGIQTALFAEFVALLKAAKTDLGAHDLSK